MVSNLNSCLHIAFLEYKFHDVNLIFFSNCPDFVDKFHIIVLDSKLWYATILRPIEKELVRPLIIGGDRFRVIDVFTT